MSLPPPAGAQPAPGTLRSRLSGPGACRAAALGLVGLLVVTLTSGVAPQASAAPGPALTLLAGPATLTATRSPEQDEDGQTRVPAAFVSTGAAIVAGSAPVVVTARRAAYGKPVTATLRVGKVTKSLPAGTADLDGLADFTTTTVKNSAGKVVSSSTDGTCLGSGYEGGRTRPDAPDSSPYPDGCSSGPFAFGAVFGLQAGWGSSSGYITIDGPDGDYTVTTAITKRWRSLLSIPADRASVSSRVTVKTVPASDEDGGEGGDGSPVLVPGAVPTAGAVARTSAALPTLRAAAVRRSGNRADVEAYRRADAARAARLAELQAAGAGGAASPAGTAGAGAAAAGAGARPDLRSLPAFGISLVKGKDIGKEKDPKLAEREFVTFAASTWNAGPGPMVVEGFRPPGKDVMTAYQFFYDKGKQSSYRKVGSLQYHSAPEHDHWHFLDFAQYNLLDAKGKLLRRSGKQAWCLAPTDSVDLTVPGAALDPGQTGLSSTCGDRGALSIREVLPTGWADSYSQYQVGDAFDVTDLPNGKVQIEIVANPANRLIETSTSNNRSRRTIVLGGTKGARTVTVPPYQGIDAN